MTERMILNQDECREYHEALADVVCWFEGFEAAGKEVRKVNLSAIEELKSKLRKAM